MTIQTMDAVVAAFSTARRKSLYFPTIATVAGRLADLSAGGATRYGQMATPAAIGSGGTLHADTDVGFPQIAAPGGSNELALLNLVAAMQNPGSLTVYERIWSCSGMSGTVNTAQTITGFPALTIPDANGTGLEMFAEIYTQIGTTGVNITASYTDTTGTPGRTTRAAPIGATGVREVFRLVPMPLQDNDQGVSSIASATLSATTGTAGNFGLVLAKRLATVMAGAAFGGRGPMDFADLGMPKIDAGAALMFVFQGTTTSTGIIDGLAVIGEG